MASDVVIRAEGLGKKYLIGHRSTERYSTLRDIMSRSAKNWVRSLRDITKAAANVAGDEIEEFWALRDVDFEIRRGDVVGVIGRNGAGKSTLLKVLSRITEPSAGRVEIKGRIASLLEVGTGFHPELTGRENVYLNGAVLGMTREEIKRKFDEIVAFAETEKFLDTPVKRYSSGMYVRLAFAVAAHLEPEILVVDEVLAVGDAEFQQKCLGKIQDVAHGGRTVLFVSHNMSSVSALCGTGILLNAGQIALKGDIGPVIEKYKTVGTKAGKFLIQSPPENSSHWIQSAEIAFTDGCLFVNAAIKGLHERTLILNVRVRDSLGAPIGVASLGGFNPSSQLKLAKGIQDVAVKIKLPNLANGVYNVDLDIEQPYSNYIHRVTDALRFESLRAPSTQFGRVLEAWWGVGSIELNFEQVSLQAVKEVESRTI